MKRIAEEDGSLFKFFVALYRSKISATGCLTPTLNHKHVRRSPKLQRWAAVHGLKPFYATQLFHTSSVGVRTVTATYIVDEDAYFGQVMEIRRSWLLQIEGAARVWDAGFYRVVWRIKLAPDYEDLGPLHFITKVVESDPMRTLLTPDEQDKLDRKELVFSEEELEANSLLTHAKVHETHTPGGVHYIWYPPNPGPLQEPDPVLANMHPNDRPFGAPEPVAAPEPEGFGFQVQQQLFQLRNRLNAGANNDAARPIIDPQAAAAALAAPQPQPPNGQQQEPPADEPTNPARRNDGPFPVNQWFDLLAGFIQVKNPHDGVCFAITNVDFGYKYGLFIDYVALVPVTRKEFEHRDSFPLGPILMEDTGYWDFMCETAFSSKN